MTKRSKISEIDFVFKKKVKSSELAKITNSQETNKILRQLWSSKIELYEEMVLLLLNNSNKVLGWVKISQGSITGTLIDNRLIILSAIKTAATGIILAHNHPSGNTLPSQADLSCTKKLNECCKMFDIKLVDHIILSGDTNNYYSFADEGNI